MSDPQLPIFPPTDSKGNYLPYGPRGQNYNLVNGAIRKSQEAPELPEAVYAGDGVNTTVVSNAAQPGAIAPNYLMNTASVGSVDAPNIVENQGVGVNRPQVRQGPPRNFLTASGTMWVPPGTAARANIQKYR